MKKAVFVYFLFILPFGILVDAHEAFAAEIYFAPHTGDIYVDDIFVIEARIVSPNELINVADGAFLFDPTIMEVTELSVGGSVFSLWATEPSFSNTKGRVNFVGGVPGGFQGEDGLMVKAIFRAKGEGETTLSFESDFSLLLSDGKGTLLRPQAEQRSLVIAQRPSHIPSKDEWKDLIETDTLPPQFVEAIISRDSRYFDNKYFANFFATDEKSGIAYYEIKEGDRPFVRAVSPYVLQEQQVNTVHIKAVDSAGNENIVSPEFTPVSPAPLYTTLLFWVVMLVLGIVAGVAFYTMRLKFKK